jgi:tetratricopeptide (TPR) repeat protein
MNRLWLGLATSMLAAIATSTAAKAESPLLSNSLMAVKGTVQLAAFSPGQVVKQSNQEYGQPVRIDPEKAESLYKEAITLLRGGRYTDAIRDYDRVIRSYPEFTPALINRGAAYAALGNYDHAISDYSRALRLKPDNGDAYFNRGLAYDRLGVTEAAIADFSEAVRLKPGNPDTLNSRGLAYARQGHYDLALADFNEAIRLKPVMAEAWQNRGSVYARMVHFDSAMADYDQAIKLNPKSRQALAGRGRTNFFQGRFEEAAADFRQALQLKPDDAYTLLWAALALGQSGTDVRDLLDGALGRLDADEWPVPLIEMLAGKATAADTLASAQSPDGEVGRERRTEAYFYIGQYALLHGDKGKAADAFRAAVAEDANATAEYLGAKAELARLEQ